MTSILNAYSFVRQALADTRYGNPEMYSIVSESHRTTVTRNRWDRANATPDEQLTQIPEVHRETFLRLVKDLALHAPARPPFGDLVLAWDDESPTTTALIRPHGHDDVLNIPRASRQFVWVGSPDVIYSLDELMESLRPADSESYLTMEWGDTTGERPQLFVTYKPEAFAAPLRRFFDAKENGELFSEPGQRVESSTGYGPVFGLNEDGEIVFDQVGYRKRSIASILDKVNMTDRLQRRREETRTALLQGLPGFQKEVRDKQKEVHDQALRREQAGKRYEAFRSKQKPDSVKHIPTLPFVPRGVLSTRNWGIEIETGAGRDLSGTPDGWDNKGDGSLESAYENQWLAPEDCPEYSDSHEPTQIVTHNDGSSLTIPNPDYEDPRYCSYCGYNGSSYDDDDCVELVSPILKSMHSAGLKQICDDLEHAPRTETAGVHVHVEARDLTVRQIGQLVLAYDHIEPLLEASYDRVERGYCKRRSPNEVLTVARQRDDAIGSANMRHGDRYVTVNLNALAQHGTVEFRAMGPVYNYDHLTRWAMFCREMVNAAKNGATAKEWNKVTSWDGVLKMFGRYGIEYNMAAGVPAVAEEPELVEV